MPTPTTWWSPPARSRRSTSLGKVLIDPGDLIAIEAPAYVGALSAFGAYEPRYLPIELDDEGMVVEQLEEALVRGERPKFVYTVPNFGNPAGVTMSYARREHLVALCREATSRSSRTTRTACCGSRASPMPCLRIDGSRRTSSTSAPSRRSSRRACAWVGPSPNLGVLQRLVLAKEAADLCGCNLNMLVTER